MSNPIDSTNSIFVVGCWVENDIQAEYLIKCIENIRKIKSFDILLVSHHTVPNHIVEMVDYFIYDKKNPLLSYDDFYLYNNMFNTVWFENQYFKVLKKLSFRHDYAVLTSMKNAFNFAKYLGKKFVFYLEYDCIIRPEEFEKEFISPLSCNDICVIDGYSAGFLSYFYCCVYSSKIDFILNFINKFESLDHYFKSLRASDCILLEDFFKKTITSDTNNKIYCSSYVVNGSIDLCSTGISSCYKVGELKVFIHPCQDDNGNLYFFIKSSGSGSKKSEKIFITFLGKMNEFLCYRNEMSYFKIGSVLEIKGLFGQKVLIESEYGSVVEYLIDNIINESQRCKIIMYNKTDDSKYDLVGFYESLVNKPFIRKMRCKKMFNNKEV